VEDLTRAGAARSQLAAPSQLAARGLDVGDDQAQAQRGTGAGWRDVRAELDRAPGAGRRELEQAELAGHDVGVEPPPEVP
jgi:hypothetical protein